MGAGRRLSEPQGREGARASSAAMGGTTTTTTTTTGTPTDHAGAAGMPPAPPATTTVAAAREATTERPDAVAATVPGAVVATLSDEAAPAAAPGAARVGTTGTAAPTATAPSGTASAAIAPLAEPADPGALRRTLGLALPFAQVFVGFLPALGVGQPVGALSAASQTPAIPAGYAFSIWIVIFALSVGWGVWQWLPAHRDAPLARRLGWPLVGVFAANATWQFVAQLSSSNGFHLVAIILVGLGLALLAFFLALREPSAEGAAAWIVPPLTGLMAGWLSAAAFANVSGAARAAGIAPAEGFGATMFAVLVLLAAGGFATGVAWVAAGRSRAAWWYVGAVAWALAAVVLANLGINALNLPAALAAGAMLALVVALALARRRAAAAAVATA